MKHAIRALGLVLALLPALAEAQQFPSTFPPNTLYGRLGVGPGPGQAIPINRLTNFAVSASTIYVDHTLGSTDPANNCLSQGAGACATILQAYHLLQTRVKAPPGVYPTIQTDCGFTESPLIVGAVTSGGGAVIIRGNPTSLSTIAACVWTSTGADGMVIEDGAVIGLNGYTARTPGGGATWLTVTKGGILSHQNMIWSSAVGGNNVLIGSGGVFVWDGGIYQVGDTTCAPTCFDTHVKNVGGTWQMPNAGSGITVPNALTFSQFYAGNGGDAKAYLPAVISVTGAGSGAGSTGTKYAIINGAGGITSGIVFPGATAGTRSPGSCWDSVCSVQITASLGADVTMNNNALYFNGPAVAQGTAGTWWAAGTVTAKDTTGASTFFCKLWDGTTIISTAVGTTGGASFLTAISLSGYLASPAGNIRIDCRDISNATGLMIFNATGNSKDSTVSAFRLN